MPDSGVTPVRPIAGAGETFAFRLPVRLTLLLAIGWTIAAMWLAWPAILQNLEAYRELGDTVYLAGVGGLFSLLIAVVIHHKLRRLTARAEPAALVALVILACLWKEPRGSVAIFLLVTSAFAIGNFAKHRLNLETDSAAANIGLSGSLGLGAQILVLMALGAAGLLGTLTAACLLVAPCLLFWHSLAEVWRAFRQLSQGWSEFSLESHWLPSVAQLNFVVFGGFTLAVALTPTISADAIRYHLPSAIYYFETGSVAPVPGLSGSHLPQAIELLMSLAISWGDVAAAQFVNPIFLLLSAALIYVLSRECGFGRLAGVLSVVVGVCVPFVHWSGSVVKVDLAVAVFQLASLYCFIRGMRLRTPNWLLAGLTFLALSAGAKLTAIYGAIPLGLMHAYLFVRLTGQRARFRPLHITALVVLVVVIAPFWQYRTYLAVGSPWYPMNAGLLTKHSPPLEGVRPGPIEAYFLYPWITHFQGRMSFEGPSNNPAGVFLVFFAPVWLLVRRTRPSFVERAYLFFVVISYIYWGHMWAFLRYGIPMFLLFCILTAGRLADLFCRGSRVVRHAITTGLLFGTLFSTTVTARYEINAPQLRYLAGNLSRREFLLEANRDYQTIEKLSQIAKPGELTFSIDNFGVLYAPDPALFSYGHSMAHSPLADNARTRIFERLAKRNYRYLILPRSSQESYEPELSNLYDLRLRFEDGTYLLYQIDRNSQ